MVYGRRRVGKTTLLKKFSENIDSIYYLCSKRNIEYNLKKFSEKICDHIGIPTVSFRSFREAFEAILSRKGKIAVIIDEFRYLVERDKGVLSDFQEIIDDLLKDSMVKLVICGSTVSMMETEVLGYRSPLYGRATVQMKIKPLFFQDLFKWYPRISFENAVKIYSVTGGIPKYLEFFKGKT